MSGCALTASSRAALRRSASVSTTPSSMGPGSGAGLARTGGAAASRALVSPVRSASASSALARAHLIHGASTLQGGDDASDRFKARLRG
jgi:hypothetical protein